MSNNINKFPNSILSFHRYSKRIIAIMTDACLCILCTWLAFSIRSMYWIAINPRLEYLILFKELNYISILMSLFIAIPVFWLFGLYRTIFSHTSFSIIFTISPAE